MSESEFPEHPITRLYRVLRESGFKTFGEIVDMAVALKERHPDCTTELRQWEDGDGTKAGLEQLYREVGPMTGKVEFKT